MTRVDWNAFIHTLDTLSEGAYSFVELDDYMSRHHGRDVVQQCITLLAKQDLIRVFQAGGDDASHHEQQDEGRQTLADQFLVVVHRDRASKVTTWLELTERGAELLRLIGLGHASG